MFGYKSMIISRDSRHKPGSLLQRAGKCSYGRKVPTMTKIIIIKNMYCSLFYFNCMCNPMPIKVALCFTANGSHVILYIFWHCLILSNVQKYW